MPFPAQDSVDVLRHAITALASKIRLLEEENRLIQQRLRCAEGGWARHGLETDRLTQRVCQCETNLHCGCGESLRVNPNISLSNG